MSSLTKRKRRAQLGMSPSTASARLKKLVLFALLQRHGENVCYRCSDEIECVGDLSVDHKVPWMDSSDPTGLYFDPDNIAFSHQRCNSAASRGTRGFIPEHGTMTMYKRRGCHCTVCRQKNASYEMERKSRTPERI